MKLGWPISILLHALLALGGMMSFSKISELDEGRVVPVELLTVDDLTNIKAAIKAPPKKNKPDETPMQLEKPMENAPEKGDISKRNETQDSSPPPRENVKGDEAPVETPKPQTPAFDLDSMSALIDKARDTQPEANQQKALQSELSFYEYAQNAREGAGDGTALTMNELDALQTAMYKCWRIPADAKNPEELIVRVKVSLRSDGHVQSVDVMDKAAIANSSNPYMKVAAQRAVTAVSKCAPYDFLPVEKYDRWKNMTLRFKPEL